MLQEWTRRAAELEKDVLLKGIPTEVIAECREKARLTARPTKPHCVAAIAAIAIWIICAVVAFRWITQ